MVNMKVTTTTLPRKSASVTCASSCEVSANSGAGAIFGRGGSREVSCGASRESTSRKDASVANAASAMMSAARMSALQLALELIEEPPVRGLGDDLVRVRLDHAR